MGIEEAITKLYSIAGIVIIMMIPLLFIGTIVCRIQLRIERYEEAYNAIKETVSAENHPKCQTLRALATSWQFRKEIPEFKQAVREKLKTYDMVPTSMEKTMTPAQLYRTNSPLWMSGMNVMAIKNIIILENQLGKDIVAERIDEFL